MSGEWWSDIIACVCVLLSITLLWTKNASILQRKISEGRWKITEDLVRDFAVSWNYMETFFASFLSWSRSLLCGAFVITNSRMCWHSTVTQNACRFIMNSFTIMLDYLVYIRYVEKVSGGYSICIYGIWYMTKKYGKESTMNRYV